MVLSVTIGKLIQLSSFRVCVCAFSCARTCVICEVHSLLSVPFFFAQIRSIVLRMFPVAFAVNTYEKHRSPSYGVVFEPFDEYERLPCLVELGMCA